MKHGNKRYSYILITALLIASAWFQSKSSWVQPTNAQNLDGSVIFLSDSIAGMVPGQSLRLTVALMSDRSGPILSGYQCLVFDRNGVLVFESERSEVPAGGFGQLDVPYGELGMDTEAGTGKKQFLIKVITQASSNFSSSPLINGEILNEQSGATESQIHLSTRGLEGSRRLMR